MIEELSVSRLRAVCDPEVLPCETSAESQPIESIIGQERAVRALEFGLGIQAMGFNIYVSGYPGTGRLTAAQRFLEEVAAKQPTPPDWCCVNNFQDPYCPQAICLPPGRGRAFQTAMSELVQEAQSRIGQVFESEEYAAKRQETVKSFQQQREELFERLSDRAREDGFALQATPMGLVTVPVKDGAPLSNEQFRELSQEEKDAIAQKSKRLQGELQTTIRQARGLEKGARQALEGLDREVALFALGPLIEERKEQYADLEEVVVHLEAVQEDILDNLSQFRSEEQEEEQPVPLPTEGARELPFRRYQVNVLVDNSQRSGAPVIMELNPTYSQLFGRMEKEARLGTLFTDFTLIKKGSLHDANGGYLLLPAEEVLRNLFSWDSLKRALRNGEIVIEEAGERLGLMATKGLQPEPIPLKIKVILMGQPMLYQLLYAYDEDFRELFKVKADFDTQMPRTEDGVSDYVGFVCRLCTAEGLRHLDRSALGKVVEYGSRLAENGEKLSTRFGELADIIREADYYAVRESSEHITEAHIMAAIESRLDRSSLIYERIQEAIERDVILIDVTGEVAGQVNGLSVSSLGGLTFGRPNRITVSLGLGREGLVDLERESRLGGPIHSKGVMILAGYLTETYAQAKPLSLAARLVFEQSYSGVEGDSASSAELYALLSSLSRLPIRQGIAVTGSVNQKGEVQAIGAVNEKIEGFYDICRAKGFSGEQGVLIPQGNLRNLMLKEEVVQAVAAGQFHVWAVATVEEGIELLTGVPAGRRLDDGTFEADTVHARVNQRLSEMAEAMRKFARPQGAEKKESPGAAEEKEEETPAEEGEE